MAAKYNCWASLLLAGLLAAGCGQNASVAPAPAAQNAPPPPKEDEFERTLNYDAPYFNLKKIEIHGKTDSSALTENGALAKEVTMDSYQLVTNDPAHVTNALE